VGYFDILIILTIDFLLVDNVFISFNTDIIIIIAQSDGNKKLYEKVLLL
jgi:hypothetical protein